MCWLLRCGLSCLGGLPAVRPGLQRLAVEAAAVTLLCCPPRVLAGCRWGPALLGCAAVACTGLQHVVEDALPPASADHAVVCAALGCAGSQEQWQAVSTLRTCMSCMRATSNPCPSRVAACRCRSQTKACCPLSWTSCTTLAWLQQPTALQRRPVQQAPQPLLRWQPHRQQLLTWRRSWPRAAADLIHLECQRAQVQAHLRLQQAPQIRYQPVHGLLGHHSCLVWGLSAHGQVEYESASVAAPSGAGCKV